VTGINTVTGTNCALCGEAILPEEDARPVGGRDRGAHRECLLRAVVGGIGHLEDHAYWCTYRGDTDAGHTYRESARLVDDWLAAHEGKVP